MRILVLPGDGIGPEITAATLTVLERANALFKLDLRWQHEEIGLPSLKKEGTTLPARVLDAARSSDGVLLGPLSTYEYPAREKGGINPSAEFRTRLDLYANIRPARSRMGVGLTGKPVDLVIYRENTEGFYADRNMHVGVAEFMPTEDIALAVRRVTAKCCERIARRAFEAATNRRRKVTSVHKANVFRISDGLWLREVRKVAQDFPKVQLEEVIVDAMAARSTPGTRTASRRRSTARLRTLQVKTRRIPPRSSFPRQCCSNGWPRATATTRSPPPRGTSTRPSTRP